MSNIELAFTAVIGTFTILGILELRVGRMVKRLVKDYLSELKPNGGSSVKDAVNRLEKSQDAQSKRLDDLFTILVKKVDKE
jgi:hypothetical protein